MKIHASPIGHSVEYAQLNSIATWLYSSEDDKMPIAFEIIKAFLAQRPLVIETNGHQSSYPSLIHYCLSKPEKFKNETMFTLKLAQLFSRCEMAFTVNLLLCENNQGLNCYDIALKRNLNELANFFEKTIESYNLSNHNQNTPEVLNAFISPNVTLDAFTTKIHEIDPKVFESMLKTKSGIHINCAQAILILQQAYPDKGKSNAIESLLGKDKLKALLETGHSLTSLFSKPIRGPIERKALPTHCPTSPVKITPRS